LKKHHLVVARRSHIQKNIVISLNGHEAISHRKKCNIAWSLLGNPTLKKNLILLSSCQVMSCKKTWYCLVTTKQCHVEIIMLYPLATTKGCHAEKIVQYCLVVPKWCHARKTTWYRLMVAKWHHIVKTTGYCLVVIRWCHAKKTMQYHMAIVRQCHIEKTMGYCLVAVRWCHIEKIAQYHVVATRPMSSKTYNGISLSGRQGTTCKKNSATSPKGH
jgi:hypothetical protein